MEVRALSAETSVCRRWQCSTRRVLSALSLNCHCTQRNLLLTSVGLDSSNGRRRLCRTAREVRAGPRWLRLAVLFVR